MFCLSVSPHCFPVQYWKSALAPPDSSRLYFSNQVHLLLWNFNAMMADLSYLFWFFGYFWRDWMVIELVAYFSQEEWLHPRSAFRGMCSSLTWTEMAVLPIGPIYPRYLPVGIFRQLLPTAGTHIQTAWCPGTCLYPLCQGQFLSYLL